MSEGHEKAFQQALDEGRRHEHIRKQGRRPVATKLAEIVSLDWYKDPSEFLVSGGSQKAGQCLPFDHIFDPESSFPPPAFNAYPAGGV